MSVARNALWNLAQYGGGKLVALVSIVVLARLLAPDAFGLVAMALLAINVFDRCKDLGVGTALVQTPARFAEVAPTGAVLTAISSVALSLMCLTGAEPIAALLGDDRLTPIVRVLSVALLISGLAVLPDAALRRRLHFADRTLPELAGALVKAGVSVGLALAGSGVWSLVWGQVAGTVVTTVLYWLAYRRRFAGEPVLGWSRPAARELLGYGAPTSAIALLALVLDNLDYFVIGRRLGPEELGYYTMAFRLPELLVVSVCVVIGQVLFSAYSRVQDDQQALRAHYLKAATTVATIAVPVGFGLAAAAPEVVRIVLGAAYSPAIEPLRFLGVYAAIYSLSFHAGEVYKATGRTRLMLGLSVVRLVVFVPVLWVAAGRSIVAVAAAFLTLQVLFTVVRLALIRWVLGLRVADQWRACWPALAAGGVAAGLVALAGSALREQAPALGVLAVEVVIGVGCYLALLSRVDPEAPGRLRGLLGSMRRDRAGPAKTDEPVDLAEQREVSS